MNRTCAPPFCVSQPPILAHGSARLFALCRRHGLSKPCSMQFPHGMDCARSPRPHPAMRQLCRVNLSRGAGHLGGARRAGSASFAADLRSSYLVHARSIVRKNRLKVRLKVRVAARPSSGRAPAVIQTQYVVLRLVSPFGEPVSVGGGVGTGGGESGKKCC